MDEVKKKKRSKTSRIRLRSIKKKFHSLATHINEILALLFNELQGFQ